MKKFECQYEKDGYYYAKGALRAIGDVVFKFVSFLLVVLLVLRGFDFLI